MPNELKTTLGGSAAPDFISKQVAEIAYALNALLAHSFALYIKTKNVHWRLLGPRLTDYRPVLDEQAEQIFATTDSIAGRLREVGSAAVYSIGDYRKLQPVIDSEVKYVPPAAILSELCADNSKLVASIRTAHGVCAAHGDAASTRLLEPWIGETERRVGFLAASTQAEI